MMNLYDSHVRASQIFKHYLNPEQATVAHASIRAQMNLYGRHARSSEIMFEHLSNTASATSPIHSRAVFDFSHYIPAMIGISIT
jgi:hypothetical protein